jgi:hypothetical protein
MCIEDTAIDGCLDLGAEGSLGGAMVDSSFISTGRQTSEKFWAQWT